jgi:hypothetical protein
MIFLSWSMVKEQFGFVIPLQASPDQPAKYEFSLAEASRVTFPLPE